MKTIKRGTKTGFAVKLVFQVTQHSRDQKLLNSLITYWGCGMYKERPGGL